MDPKHRWQLQATADAFQLQSNSAPKLLLPSTFFEHFSLAEMPMLGIPSMLIPACFGIEPDLLLFAAQMEILLEMRSRLACHDQRVLINLQ